MINLLQTQQMHYIKTGTAHMHTAECIPQEWHHQSIPGLISVVSYNPNWQMTRADSGRAATNSHYICMELRSCARSESAHLAGKPALSQESLHKVAFSCWPPQWAKTIHLNDTRSWKGYCNAGRERFFRCWHWGRHAAHVQVNNYLTAFPLFIILVFLTGQQINYVSRKS